MFNETPVQEKPEIVGVAQDFAQVEMQLKENEYRMGKMQEETNQLRKVRDELQLRIIRLVGYVESASIPTTERRY